LTAPSARQRLLLVVNDAMFFVSHRLPIALAAREAGFDVQVATGPGEAVAIIRSYGIPHHALRLSRSGTHPLGELLTFAQIARLVWRLKPDLVHLVTIKPVLYGGIAARVLGVPAVVAISGLGDAFAVHDLRTHVLKGLVTRAYRLALNRERIKVIFQNASDRDTLSAAARLPSDKVVLVRGSGVDLRTYRWTPEPEGVPVVIFAARLLRSKGVCEFVAAARQLRQSGLQARFQLAGEIDPGNASSVTAAEVRQWREEGVVEILGYRSDLASVFAASHLIVLPSYYGEGLPKVLLEAAACGRAVVTTDMPGCRDAVDPGNTALLVPPRDAEALAAATRTLLVDPARRRSMGETARVLAERDFALERIIAQHLDVYADVLRDSVTRAQSAP